MHSVRDNINISARRKFIRAGCLINDGWEESNADHHIRSLNIKTPGPEQLIMNLSGGNQQKAILGRWLSEDMKVILLDEPTRGIDVGETRNYNVIYELAKRGGGVVRLQRSALEVLGVADRIVVMREGEIAGELLHEQANEQQALSLAMPKVSRCRLSKELMMSSVTTSERRNRNRPSVLYIWDQYGMLVVFAALFVACDLCAQLCHLH